MHIGEGILTATPAGQGVLLAGTVAAVAGTMIGLRRLDEDADSQGGRAGVGLLRRLGYPGADGSRFLGPPRAQRPDGAGARLGHFSNRARWPDSAVRVLFDCRPDRAGNQHADHGPAGRDLPLPFPLDRLQQSSAGGLCQRVCRRVDRIDPWRPAVVGGVVAGWPGRLSCWPRDFSRPIFHLP